MPTQTPTRKPIDWRSMRIAEEQNLTPNPRNPHAGTSAAARNETLRDLARTILLRKAAGVNPN